MERKKGNKKRRWRGEEERGVQEKNEKKKMEIKKRGVEMCTVDPADGQRLEDGEKQQAGSTAGEMVIDLEHIQTTLHRGGHKREKTLLFYIIKTNRQIDR